MREISRALRTALAGSSDWKQTLSTRLEKLKAIIEDPACAPNALEVAQFFEHCVPDREGAIAGYVLCYRADSRRLDALARARAICIEVGDFATTARLSRLQHKNDPDPWHLANEGIAWLDAGQPDRAVKPLMKAARLLPESEDVQSALRTAQREWPSVRHEVARLMQKAEEAETYESASDSVLQAARMLRMLQTNQLSLEKLLFASLDHDPENASALGLVEQMLSHLGDKEALLNVYERRLEARTDPRERVEELRRAGTVVCRQPLYRALGVRLLQRALQIAYSKQLADIPGHLAMLGMLREHYAQAGDAGKLLPIIVQALDGPLPEVDLQYLALMGLDIALNVVDDEDSARTFAGLAVGFGAAMHPTVVQARKRNLVGEAELSLPPAMPVNDDGDTVLLDSLGLDAPPLIGKQESLGARLSAAETQSSELPGSLDLEPLPGPIPVQSLPSAAPLDLQAAHLDLQERPDPPPLEAPLDVAQALPQPGDDALDLELPEVADDALDLVELPETAGDPLDLVELPEAAGDLDLVQPEVADDALDLVELPETAGDALHLVEILDPEPEEEDSTTFVGLPESTANSLDSVELSGSSPEEALDLPDAPAMPPPPTPRKPTPPPIEKPKLPSIPKAAPKPLAAKPTATPKIAPTPRPVAAKPKPGIPKAPTPMSKGTPAPAAKAAPPKATLGKIALIPRSAMSALKQAGIERSKSPPRSVQRPPRLVMPISIEFTLEDQSCSALTRELSETGAFLITSQTIKPAQSLDLAVQMPISCDSMRSETMLVKARVIHATDTGYGVAFDDPSEEFKTRLRELISQQ